jgi:hypothetical protein
MFAASNLTTLDSEAEAETDEATIPTLD